MWVQENKLEQLKVMKETIKSNEIDPYFFMAGIGRQGGSITTAFEIVKECAGAYGIVGSEIYKAENRAEAAERFCEEALKFE